MDCVCVLLFVLMYIVSYKQMRNIETSIIFNMWFFLSKFLM